jgi:allantoate deiminase
VGTIQVESGASNVIPGETSLSLDVRHPNDARCKQAVTALVKTAQEIARRRGLRCEWKLSMKHRATPASKALTSLLASSVKAVQGSTVSLVSGAGHDGVVMATVTDIAMLFVRCRAGLSHHPDEYASPRDLSVALRVMVEFIERLAQHYRS